MGIEQKRDDLDIDMRLMGKPMAIEKLPGEQPNPYTQHKFHKHDLFEKCNDNS